jgi:hypothetical protein
MFTKSSYLSKLLLLTYKFFRSIIYLEMKVIERFASTLLTKGRLCVMKGRKFLATTLVVAMVFTFGVAAFAQSSSGNLQSGVQGITVIPKPIVPIHPIQIPPPIQTGPIGTPAPAPSPRPLPIPKPTKPSDDQIWAMLLVQAEKLGIDITGMTIVEARAAIQATIQAKQLDAQWARLQAKATELGIDITGMTVEQARAAIQAAIKTQHDADVWSKLEAQAQALGIDITGMTVDQARAAIKDAKMLVILKVRADKLGVDITGMTVEQARDAIQAKALELQWDRVKAKAAELGIDITGMTLQEARAAIREALGNIIPTPIPTTPDPTIEPTTTPDPTIEPTATPDPTIESVATAVDQSISIKPVGPPIKVVPPVPGPVGPPIKTIPPIKIAPPTPGPVGPPVGGGKTTIGVLKK